MRQPSISGFVISAAFVLAAIGIIVGFALSSMDQEMSNPALAEVVRDELDRTSLLDLFLGHAEKKPVSEESPGDEIVLPAIREGNHLYVEVELNDYQTAHLLVDTGATDIMLQPNLAADLGLSEGGSIEATYFTPNGPTQQFITTLDSVRIGDAVQYNVRASFGYGMQEGLRDGLLGMSFLKHYYVDIDLDRSELHLRPRAE